MLMSYSFNPRCIFDHHCKCITYRVEEESSNRRLVELRNISDLAVKPKRIKEECTARSMIFKDCVAEFGH